MPLHIGANQKHVKFLFFSIRIIFNVDENCHFLFIFFSSRGIHLNIEDFIFIKSMLSVNDLS